MCLKEKCRFIHPALVNIETGKNKIRFMLANEKIETKEHLIYFLGFSNIMCQYNWTLC